MTDFDIVTIEDPDVRGAFVFALQDSPQRAPPAEVKAEVGAAEASEHKPSSEVAADTSEHEPSGDKVEVAPAEASGHEPSGEVKVDVAPEASEHEPSGDKVEVAPASEVKVEVAPAAASEDVPSGQVEVAPSKVSKHEPSGEVKVEVAGEPSEHEPSGQVEVALAEASQCEPKLQEQTQEATRVEATSKPADVAKDSTDDLLGLEAWENVTLENVRLSVTHALSAWQVPVIRRRTQLGSDDQQLEKKKKEENELAPEAPKVERKRAPSRKGAEAADGATVTAKAAKTAATKSGEKQAEPQDCAGDRKPAGKSKAAAKAAPKAARETGNTRKKPTESNEVAPEASGKCRKTEKPAAGDGAKVPEQEIKTGEEEKVGKAAQTWGGRWIPSDGPQRDRFLAIKETFEKELSHRFKCQSSLQPHFFKVCSHAFRVKNLGDDSSKAAFLECAKAQVGAFITMEGVRVLA